MITRVRASALAAAAALLVGGVAAAGHSAPAADNPYAAACPAPEPQVRLGSSGPCVRKLQWYLNAAQGAGLLGTGVFGPRTQAATAAFQAAQGIRDSGVVGPLTWGALARTAPTGPATGGRPLTVNVTGFGWPDNTPPNSAEIAYPILHPRAGGAGTYADPVTFAAKNMPMFPKGLRLYLPYLQKYAIREDLCGTCTDIGIDVWVGGQGADARRVIACQDAVVRHGVQVIADPPPGLPVTPGPVFDGATGTCVIPGP